MMKQFILKSYLFSVLALTSHITKAGDFFNINIINNNSCAITIRVEGPNPGTYIWSGTIGAGATYTNDCISGIPSNIRFSDGPNFVDFPPDNGRVNTCQSRSGASCGGLCFPSAVFNLTMTTPIYGCSPGNRIRTLHITIN